MSVHVFKNTIASNPLLSIIGSILFSIVIPLIAFYIYDPRTIILENTQTTIIVSLICIITGTLITLRLDGFPGGQSGAHIFSGYTMAFIFFMSLMFLLRFNYSTVMFIANYVLTITWFLAIYLLAMERIQPHIALIDGGNTDELLHIKGVDWSVLQSPKTLDAKVEAIVADLKHDHDTKWMKFMADEVLLGRPVYHYKQILENLTGKVQIEHLSENIIGSLIPNQLYLYIKHTVDWLVALLLLPILAIISMVVAILIKTSSPGPVFYKQTRIGYRGKSFQIYKFRTMHLKSETKKDAGRDEYITHDNDDRIIRFGHFLRKARIDELPQIFNIIKGEMSWIGPRPEADSLSDWYDTEIPFYSYRHIVKPGITGWAQVNQGHVASPILVTEKLHFDFYYIKYFSAWLDFIITLKTIKIMITGFGAK